MKKQQELWLCRSIIIKLVIEDAANFNDCDDNLTFADWIFSHSLVISMAHEDICTYKCLVSLGADEEIFKAIALEEVARAGNVEALKFLLDRGIDINSTHHLLEGSTALIAAVRSDRWNMIDYLISVNADIDRQNHGGITALMSAVIQGSMTLSKKLLLAGASKELKDNDGNTALDLAVDRQDKVLIKLLK